MYGNQINEFKLVVLFTGDLETLKIKTNRILQGFCHILLMSVSSVQKRNLVLLNNSIYCEAENLFRVHQQIHLHVVVVVLSERIMTQQSHRCLLTCHRVSLALRGIMCVEDHLLKFFIVVMLVLVPLKRRISFLQRHN